MESTQNFVQNLVEYYDELHPVTQAQTEFYNSLSEEFLKPVKFLNIGCGTGILENRLAKGAADVTGLETIKELLDSATRKYRNQLMCVRFFKMSTIEMNRFLGKNFYNVISCLNDRIIFIHDKVLLKKFFFDCKNLLAQNGKVILNLTNYDLFLGKENCALPELTSIRAKLISKINCDNNQYFLSRSIETGNGKKLPIYSHTPIYPITKSEIEEFAKEAGFSSVEFFADYKKNPLTESSPSMVVVIK